MLDPEYLDEAGDLVAACYSGIEAEMLAYLSGLLAEHGPERLGQRGETALELLAQTRAPELRAIIESHSGDVSQAVRAAVLDALDRSDRADAARIGKRAAAAIAGLPREASATVEGIAAILERDNVDMVQGSLALWNRTVAAATAEVATGYADAQTAIHRAVRKMAREGIATVTYRDSETGRQTVTNRIDVAVRRHVRTQIAQDGMRRTERICEAADVELVEVSSHSPARPDHAAWQGRIFSLHGDVTVEGVRYRDLREATGYGTVTGLGGANCRHFFGPWLPGTPRMYEPDPPHPSGLPNDEVYALSQRQRARERSIRATKRELACAQSAGEKAAEVAGGQWSMRDIAEVERLKAKLRGQQKAMRDFIEDANSKGKAPVLRRAPVREWAGDMPKTAIAVSAQTKQRARKVLSLKKRCAGERLPIYDDGLLGVIARQAYPHYRSEDGYAVVLHGMPDSVLLFGEKSDHETLADIIRTRKDYEPGTPVRLLACSTGKQNGNAPCFAQRLADELGVDVTAPDDILWVHSDGTLAIGPKNGHNTGRFITYHPRRQP